MRQHPGKKSRLKRFWDSIKPPPSVPRAELDRYRAQHPSKVRRFWKSILPPPKVTRDEPVAAGPEAGRRRRLLRITAIVVLAAGLGVAAYFYIFSASSRAEAQFAAGMRLAAISQDQKAVARFSAAIRINPNLTAAYLQRGLAYRNLGKMDLAQADLEQALKFDPNLAAAHTTLGDVYRRKGDLNRAMLEFTAGINAGASVDALYQRGQAYEGLGQLQKALEDLDAAILQMPEAPWAYLTRASVREKMGDLAGAQQDRQTVFYITHPRRAPAPDPSPAPQP